jgi:hypothetical protein
MKKYLKQEQTVDILSSAYQSETVAGAMSSIDLSKNKTARILADAEKGGYGVIAAIA